VRLPNPNPETQVKVKGEVDNLPHKTQKDTEIEGRRQKAEGRRQKGEGRRQKGEVNIRY
jgi:hypothetical protein